MCLRRLTLSLIVASCVNSIWPTLTLAQEPSHTGRPIWQLFDSRNTGAGEVTYSSAIDHRGLLYAANEAGLLSYDGVSWRLLPHSKESRGITTLTELQDETWLKGSWLTGGTNGLGIYAPDITGQLSWSSIEIPVTTSSTETEPAPTIFKVMPIGGTLYIVSDVGIFILRPDGVSEAYNGKPTGFAYPHKDGIVFATENGLIEISGDKTNGLTSPPGWPELIPVTVIKSANLGQLLITKRSGVFVLNTSDSGVALMPLWDTIPAPLDTSTVLTGTLASNDGFIFGTEDGALLHFNSLGDLVARLDKRVGLHAGPMRNITAAPTGDIFAFFDGGAVWFNANDPLRVWDHLNGLEKPVTAISDDSEFIYAGTRGGLYRSLANGRMRLIPEIGDVAIHTLDLFQRSSMRGHTSLIAGTENGLIDYSNSGVTPIYSEQSSAVFISQTQPSRIAVGIGKRALLFEFNQGDWTEVGQIGTDFNAPVSDFTETTDGDLIVVLKDGTLIAFAADEWLKDQNLHQSKPLWTQTSARDFGVESSPYFASGDDTIRLFTKGAPQLWDYRSALFQIDTSIANEFAQLPGEGFPEWYATEQTADGLWLQTSMASYALPNAKSSFVALPEATRGTTTHSAIEYNEVSDKLLFATPDGVASYPSEFLLALNTQKALPTLHIRTVSVDEDVYYQGNGQAPHIKITPTDSQLHVHFAVLDWQTKCKTDGVTFESPDLENSLIPVGPQCSAAINVNDLEPRQSSLNFRLSIDGHAITESARLNITMSGSILSSPLIPLTFSLMFGLWLLSHRHVLQQPWPESVQKYGALASGLFLLLAGTQAIGLTASPHSIAGILALILGILWTAFMLPVFAEILFWMSAQLRGRSR